MNHLFYKSIEEDFRIFFREDGLSTNHRYTQNLPNQAVTCHLKFKSDMVVAGLAYFFECFNYLSSNCLNYNDLISYEGKKVKANDKTELSFVLPFNIALTGERIALNLLQRACSIATHTHKFVEKTKGCGVKIIDTRKTTPGLRGIEKYAVALGGGFNHRFDQADAWMIKDNHKDYFGGLEAAVNFFSQMKGVYKPIIAEIHDLNEYELAKNLGIKHVMLDNFSPEQVKAAASSKPDQMTIEVSGGIRLGTIENYLHRGVDYISSGSLTYDAPNVDISLKYKRVN